MRGSVNVSDKRGKATLQRQAGGGTVVVVGKKLWLEPVSYSSCVAVNSGIGYLARERVATEKDALNTRTN